MTDYTCSEDAKARLLALVAMVDGKVLDIEFESADSLMQGFSAANLESLKAAFRHTVENHGCDFDVHGLSSQLAKLEKPAKFDFVGACWYIAACDGDLPTNEEALIYSNSDQLGVSRDDSLLAQKSTG